MGEFINVSASEHSKQRSAQRGSVSWAYWRYQISSKNYFFLGTSFEGRQILCIKLKGMPFEVIVNRDMTTLITVYAMRWERRQEAKKLLGFAAWLGWQ